MNSKNMYIFGTTWHIWNKTVDRQKVKFLIPSEGNRSEGNRTNVRL